MTFSNWMTQTEVLHDSAEILLMRCSVFAGYLTAELQRLVLCIYISNCLLLMDG